MAGSVIFEERLEVPLGLATLADFRRWALSDEFPEQGRIDYLQGSVEVDMSPENLFTHGAPKVELVRALAQRVKQLPGWLIFTDRTRISCPPAEFSVEPDLVVIRGSTLADGRVRLIPSASGLPGQFVELEGAPDLIVEVVSQGSVAKDTRRLPAAFFEGGVPEYWLVDARQDLSFCIFLRGSDDFVPAAIGVDGFQFSPVLGCHYRLQRTTDPHGYWSYDLEERQ